MKNKIISNDVIKSNIQVHSILVKKGEYQKSPHFKLENVARVKSILEKLISRLPSKITKKKMIDFGCGTGFVIKLIHRHFNEVHGIDITKEMMKHVDTSPGNIFLHESLAEKTSFSDNTFDFATAYSFMDHLLDYKVFLKEVYRTLKKGGIFYCGLNPNKDFILGMEYADKSLSFGSALVDQEIKKALHDGQYYKENFGLNSSLLEKAEPIKTYDKGFNFKEVIQFAKSLGFSKTDVSFDWFLGQGQFSKKNLKKVVIIEEYLQSLLPFSSLFYKYLSFTFIK
jgi:ubiquinone/menaquinone biosynthesis C-methylase UbiE